MGKREDDWRTREDRDPGTEAVVVRYHQPSRGERACAEYVGGLLQHAGFDVRFFEFAEARTSLIARLDGSGSKPPICFTGHLDTVPLGATAWTRDPFGAEIEGDTIYGRGASDMKSGIAAIVAMALRVASMRPRAAGLTVVLTAGEETCCRGARHLAGLGVPGVAGALVVGEPTANAPLVAHKGCVRFAITTRGVAAHASMPERGDNAIHKAAVAVMQLNALDFGVQPHPLLGVPTLNVGTIAGGMNINSVPDEATIGIDIRTVPGQRDEAIYETLRATLGESAELRRLEGAGSVDTDPGHPWVQHVCQGASGTILDLSNPRSRVTNGTLWTTLVAAISSSAGSP